MASSVELDVSNPLNLPMEPQYAYRVTLVLASVLEKMAKTSLQSNSFNTVFDANVPPKIGVQQYLERIFKYTMCSGECYVLALIYIDRFRKSAMQLTPYNIHRIIITSVMLAAKFFEDAYYNNAYFAQVGGVPTAEINQMELDFLFYVSFRLHVPTDEFQSYRTLFHGRIVSAEKPMENPSLPMMGYSKPQDTTSSNNAQYANVGVSNGGETCQQQNGWTDRQQQNKQHWSGSTAVLQYQQNGNNFEKRRAGQDTPDPHSEGWTQRQQQNQHLAQQQHMHGSTQQWDEGREDTEMFEDEALHASGASNVSACKPVFGGLNMTTNATIQSQIGVSQHEAHIYHQPQIPTNGYTHDHFSQWDGSDQ